MARGKLWFSIGNNPWKKEDEPEMKVEVKKKTPKKPKQPKKPGY